MAPARRVSVKGKHIWTNNDRAIAVLLKECYNATSSDIASILNRIANRRLRQEDIQDGLTADAIGAQIRDMKTSSRGDSVRHIWSMNLTQARQAYRRICLQIEKVASDLNIKGISNLPIMQPTNGTLLRASAKQHQTATIDEWSSDSDTDSNHGSHEGPLSPALSNSPNSRGAQTAFEIVIPKASVKTRTCFDRERTALTITTNVTNTTFTTDSCSRGSWDPQTNFDPREEEQRCDDDFADTASRIRPMLTLRFDKAGNDASQRPRLLFRACDPKHGLQARAFLDPAHAITSPPSYGSEKFKKAARRHLNEDTTFASPFLSFTQNPKRAIDRHFLKSGNNLALAVIDFNEVEARLKADYGSDSGPWLVPSMCDEFGWDDIRKDLVVDENEDEDEDHVAAKWKGYRGFGEASRSLLFGSPPVLI
jgi:hypothetical protein